MKIIRRLLIGTVITILVLGIGFWSWATIRAQEATERATTILEENSVQREDGQLVFQPALPTTKGLIYYPGGLVDPEAYAGTAQGLADAGYLVVVPKMPLNLAFTGINKADEIIAEFPEITSWVIGGHSLGGAMAAEYAKNNTDKVDGLIMYASYPANSEEFIDFPMPILCITASNDPGSPNQQAFYEVISNSATLVVIEGGTHLQYADYEYQPNDGIPTITSEEQQEEIVNATVQFLEELD